MSPLPFGNCLWWRLPRHHIWNRVAERELGQQVWKTWAEHPFHVTIRTNVTESTPNRGFLTQNHRIQLGDSVQLTCTSFSSQRFYAMEVPVTFAHAVPDIEDPHISLGYRIDQDFSPSEVAAATRALAAMRRASRQWDVRAEDVVLIDCSKPIPSWSQCNADSASGGAGNVDDVVAVRRLSSPFDRPRP